MLATRCAPIAAAVALLAYATAAAAANNPYLQGYAQALLDRNYPDLAVTITDTDASGRVTLSSDACVPTWLREAVENTLIGNKEITAVQWNVQCTKAQAATVAPPEKVEPLPRTRLFRPLLADPREARFSASLQHHRINGQSFNAASVSFGEEFGFARGHWHGGEYQLGVEGGVFALFNMDTSSHDLENADYMVGFPLTWRRNAWSYRARLYHISSHLGDEFLLRNPDVERINLSYEAVDGLVSWEHNNLRLYGGGGWLFDTQPDLDPWTLHYGLEYLVPRAFGGYDLYFATDIKQSQAQDWIVNQSYQLGLSFRHGDRLIRFALEYYNGLSPNGQFFTDHLNYYGFGIQLGL